MAQLFKGCCETASSALCVDQIGWTLERGEPILFAGFAQATVDMDCPSGVPHDAAGLFDSLYDELKRIAHRHLSSGRNTLATTALVHEAYLKLADVRVADEAHLLNLASPATSGASWGRSAKCWSIWPVRAGATNVGPDCNSSHSMIAATYDHPMKGSMCSRWNKAYRGWSAPMHDWRRWFSCIFSEA